MTPPVHLADAIPWTPPSDDDESRDYVQARLGLYAKLIFAVSCVLVAFVVALYEGYPAQRPPHDHVVLATALIGPVVFGVIWLALGVARFSRVALHRIDALLAMTIGVLFAVAAFVQTERYAAIYSALSFAVFARTIVVPSSGARTLAVSSLSFAPLLVAAVATVLAHAERLDMMSVPFLAGVVLFAGVAILLATTGSRVIYGLRRRVSKAMRLGQYTLGEKIGEGGMGTVYRAHHAMLRRPTAIKLLAPDRHGPASLRRFEREVQSTSQLTHPNTVAVYDYGHSDGIFYYAMELLDGVDLETLVRLDGPQPPARVIHILRQVCGALDEAHGVGLIHRDIKPANVILCRRGGKPDVAKVVDFGLVKELTRATTDTGVAEIAGTPAYLAPEAITSPERVGPHSDLYALGAVGYFLLTGHRVFDGKTAVHVCAQHVSAEPTRPSLRTDRPIPADLEALILRCLAKVPADRPPGAQALRIALGALPAARDWDETIAAEWWREFVAHRPARPAADPTTIAPLITLSRDLTDVDAPIAQPATTAHAT